MEVLFTFLAERHERKSVPITSNRVFSEWGRIFKDPMTTAAAIDRLIHDAVIIETVGISVRADEAEALKERQTTDDNYVLNVIDASQFDAVARQDPIGKVDSRASTRSCRRRFRFVHRTPTFESTG